MSNPNPSPDTRYGAVRQNPKMRPTAKWLHGVLGANLGTCEFAKRFNAAAREAGAETVRAALALRLLEIAFTDEVVVVGKDSDGELIKRASGRESVDAIKLLYSYDLGKPPASPDERALALATHFRQVAKDAAEIVLAALGSRKEKMEPAEVAAFIAQVGVNTGQYLQQADAVIGGPGEAASAPEALQESSSNEPGLTWVKEPANAGPPSGSIPEPGTPSAGSKAPELAGGGGVDEPNEEDPNAP